MCRAFKGAGLYQCKIKRGRHIMIEEKHPIKGAFFDHFSIILCGLSKKCKITHIIVQYR